MSRYLSVGDVGKLLVGRGVPFDPSAIRSYLRASGAEQRFSHAMTDRTRYAVDDALLAAMEERFRAAAAPAPAPPAASDARWKPTLLDDTRFEYYHGTGMEEAEIAFGRAVREQARKWARSTPNVEDFLAAALDLGYRQGDGDFPAFPEALRQYGEAFKRPFPTLRETLHVLRTLGYALPESDMSALKPLREA